MIGDLAFFHFAESATSSGNPPVATTSQIMLTPLVSSAGLGLSFSATVNGVNYFSIPNPTQPESVDYHLEYTVDAPVLSGGSLKLDPPFGNVLATQQYCVGDKFANDCASGTPAQQSVTPASPDSSIAFTVPSSFVDIRTEISLNASPDNPAGFDALTALVVEQSSAVPEPSNIMMAGIGFCVLMTVLFIARQRRRQNEAV